MTDKPKRSKRSSEQSRRFIETARRIGADKTDERFERNFRNIVPPTKRQPKRSQKT